MCVDKIYEHCIKVIQIITYLDNSIHFSIWCLQLRRFARNILNLDNTMLHVLYAYFIPLMGGKMGTMRTNSSLDIPTTFPLQYDPLKSWRPLTHWQFSNPKAHTHEWRLIDSPVRNLSLVKTPSCLLFYKVYPQDQYTSVKRLHIYGVCLYMYICAVEPGWIAEVMSISLGAI